MAKKKKEGSEEYASTLDIDLNLEQTKINQAESKGQEEFDLQESLDEESGSSGVVENQVDDFIHEAMSSPNYGREDVVETGLAKAPSIYQSWQLTKMKYSFTRTEKNLFLKIIEVAQKHLKREYLGKDCDFQLNEEFGKEQPSIEFPIRDLLKKSHNYDRIRDSLHSLFKKDFGIPKDESWDFDMVNLFSRVQSSEKRGLVRVTLTNEFWKAFYNLKVFKELDPSLAYNFDSLYTVRIYEMLVGNKVAMTYDIQNLVNMFCLEDTYATTSEFIRRVIKVAQKEMKEMEACPFYFDYDLVYKGRKIDKIVFTVVDKHPSEKRVKMAKLAADGIGIELSEKIISSVKKLFRTEIREDLGLKLKRVQKLIGEKKLASQLGYIYEKAKELKDKKELKSTFAAYLSGALDNIYEQEKMMVQEKKSLKIFAQDVKPIEEETRVKDGFVYFTKKDLEKKSKMSGFDSLEDFIKQLPTLEQVDKDKWRMKG